MNNQKLIANIQLFDDGHATLHLSDMSAIKKVERICAENTGEYFESARGRKEGRHTSSVFVCRDFTEFDLNACKPEGGQAK